MSVRSQDQVLAGAQYLLTVQRSCRAIQLHFVDAQLSPVYVQAMTPELRVQVPQADPVDQKQRKSPWMRGWKAIRFWAAS